MDLCERATQRMGARVSQRWWEQEGIDLEVAKKRATDSTATSSESDSESEAESDLESEEGWVGISTSSGVSGSSGADWSGAE